MYSFETDRAAKEFVREHVDMPAAENVEALSDGMILHTFSQELEEGRFTNVYDLSFRKGSVHPSIEFHDKPISVFEHVSTRTDIKVATSSGFFFLADQASATPRQLSLNLAFLDGQMHGFPVVDREAVLTDGEHLSTAYVEALGVLAVDNTDLSWSGSLTQHETDIKVFANGNSIITHVQNDATGNIRVLDENSRYTPAIETDDTTDIGFIRREDGVFIGVSSNKSGGLDIFSHDVIIRTHERYAHGELPEMRVRMLGNNAVDSTLHGAISVGPMLDATDFTTHPINKDETLGGKPPFFDVPLARTVLYETDDEIVHIRLFDGRPGSSTFPGVTPNQVAHAIKNESEVAWGCFLDPGQSAKLVVKVDDDITCHGNTHYLKWPRLPGEKFVWTPKTSRPVASMITLH